ncbi:hypothetical protein [Rossellomorea arthrocnemi]|jgi:hypothetical protein|uniref:hypothetical protein n=1 Tax=Rossellomorea arthrocnemi TaxID=2769542 RepID=UPI00191B44FC|nr:hypothetical protein [Rossellomorea arthrocnemi]
MKAVFLDRNGTIGGTGGGMHPMDFELYSFTPAAIRKLGGNRGGVGWMPFVDERRYLLTGNLVFQCTYFINL